MVLLRRSLIFLTRLHHGQAETIFDTLQFWKGFEDLRIRHRHKILPVELRVFMSACDTVLLRASLHQSPSQSCAVQKNRTG